MQLTYRGTTYTQPTTTVATTQTAIGHYRGATFPIHTVTTPSGSRNVAMTYRGVTYLGTTTRTALPLVPGVEGMVSPNLAIA